MKRIISFAAIYVLSMLVGTFVFATLFMFGCNLTMFVTGLPASFFSLDFFMRGILLSVPLVCVLIQILFVLYLIRHPSSHFVSLIMYAIFGLASWLVLIPADLGLISRYNPGAIYSRTEASSDGIFRKEPNGIFYYSRVKDEGLVDGLYIDTNGYFGQEGRIIHLFDVRVRNESAFPYSDILIKNSLQPSQLVVYPLEIYSALLATAQRAAYTGFSNWLSFASLGLALLMIYALQFTSSWKLASVTSVIAAAGIIVSVNYLYYMGFLPSVLKEISSRLSELGGGENPLIVLSNLIISVLLFLFGIFMGIYRLRGNSAMESEE